MINLDTEADFMWSFRDEFFLVTPDGNYIWSDPDYGGDNTIQRFHGTLADWCHKLRLLYVRGKGKHKIGNYCGKEVVIIQ